MRNLCILIQSVLEYNYNTGYGISVIEMLIWKAEFLIKYIFENNTKLRYSFILKKSKSSEENESYDQPKNKITSYIPEFFHTH